MGNSDSKYVHGLPRPKSDSFILYGVQMLAAGEIYLINVSDMESRIIQDTFSHEWSNKCKIESKYPFIKKLDLDSSPFNKFTTEDCIKSRHLFCKLNDNLLHYGYKLVCAPQFVHRNGLSSWIYSKSHTQSDIMGQYCAISLSLCSELQFIDFPSGLVEELASLVTHVYGKSFQDDNERNNAKLLKDAENSKVDKLEEVMPRQYKMKLSGSPWIATGKNSLLARSLLIEMISFMYSWGFKLKASTLLKQETSDCLFFARSSAPIDPNPNYHILLALKGDDYIVLFGANPEIVECFRTFFFDHWKEGLKDLTEKHGYPVIALNGNPWLAEGFKEIEMKKMLMNVLEDASEMGYEPIESIDCSRGVEDKSGILLTKTAPCRMHFICLSVSLHSDKFYIINASPKERDIIRNEMRRSYSPGIEKEEAHGNSWKIQFRCNPISGKDTKATICFQAAILSILHELGTRGFKLKCSADVSKHMIYRNDPVRDIEKRIENDPVRDIEKRFQGGRAEMAEALSAHSLFMAKPLSNID